MARENRNRTLQKTGKGCARRHVPRTNFVLVGRTIEEKEAVTQIPKTCNIQISEARAFWVDDDKRQAKTAQLYFPVAAPRRIILSLRSTEQL